MGGLSNKQDPIFEVCFEHKRQQYDPQETRQLNRDNTQAVLQGKRKLIQIQYHRLQDKIDVYQPTVRPILLDRHILHPGKKGTYINF